MNLKFLNFNLLILLCCLTAVLHFCHGLTSQNKSIDYNPFTNQVLHLKPEDFGLTKEDLERLFILEVEKDHVEVLQTVNNGRAQLTPPTELFSQSVDSDRLQSHIVKLQLNALRSPFNDSIGQSPLRVKSNVPGALQSSHTARIIDAQTKIGLKVSKRLATDLIGDGGQFDFNPVNVLASFQAPGSFCPFKVNHACDATSRFPNIDGSCNNLASPWLGKTETPFKRYAPPSYDDNLSTPRKKSVSGKELPNPRLISRRLFTDNLQFDSVWSHMVAPFGQFVAHDITSASISAGNYY
jgi:hypothetical protein